MIPTTDNEVVPYLVAFFILLGLPLVLMAGRIRVTVTDQSIRYVGLNGKVREIRWDEVRKVTFSFTSEIVLHSEPIRIKLNTMLTGFTSFLEVMKRRLDPELYGTALKKYEATLDNTQRHAGSPEVK